jgi:glycosyltransferase involved in cell wall biosynthesis
MACGVPIVAHEFPVTRWIVGDAGETVNMEAPGAVRRCCNAGRRSRRQRAELAQQARQRAETVFAGGHHPLYRRLYADIRASRKP